MTKSVNISSYPTIENFSFGAVKLTKHNNDVELHKYSDMVLHLMDKYFFNW